MTTIKTDKIIHLYSPAKKPVAVCAGSNEWGTFEKKYEMTT